MTKSRRSTAATPADVRAAEADQAAKAGADQLAAAEDEARQAAEAEAEAHRDAAAAVDKANHATHRRSVAEATVLHLAGRAVKASAEADRARTLAELTHALEGATAPISLSGVEAGSVIAALDKNPAVPRTMGMNLYRANFEGSGIVLGPAVACHIAEMIGGDWTVVRA